MCVCGSWETAVGACCERSQKQPRGLQRSCWSLLDSALLISLDTRASECSFSVDHSAVCFCSRCRFLFSLIHLESFQSPVPESRCTAGNRSCVPILTPEPLRSSVSSGSIPGSQSSLVLAADFSRFYGEGRLLSMAPPLLPSDQSRFSGSETPILHR